MKLRLSATNREFDIEILAREGSSIRARIDDREVSATFDTVGTGEGRLSIGERRFHLLGARRMDSIIVTVGPRTYELFAVEDTRRGSRGLAAPEIVAPMPGKVLRVLVGNGDTVETGQPLVVIEAMKMETTLAAESPAIVKRVCVQAGQMVDHGAVLIELSPNENPSARESLSPAS